MEIFGVVKMDILKFENGKNLFLMFWCFGVF
jgi:hypothetical protein